MDPAQRPSEVSQLVDHLFRLQSAKMKAVLLRYFGYQKLETAEEIVQETLLRALRAWSLHGAPPAPEAWLMTTAKNLAVDHVRASNRAARLELETQRIAAEFDPERIEDDLLRMVFSCCEPRLDIADQLALTLHFACGLSAEEIASALLLSHEAVRKRLYRARHFLRKNGGLEIASWDSGAEARLEAVLHVVYLLFNEGYHSAGGGASVRLDLCADALRLARLLLDVPLGRRPQSHALLALLSFQAARLPSRTSEDGSLRVLEEQDRSVWNKELIQEGFRALGESASGTQLTRYHLEAGIAACHCSAESTEDTDWAAIVELYDTLVALDGSPVARLNRAIAVGYRDGPEAALRELRSLEREGSLKHYHLLHASLGEFYRRAGQNDLSGPAFDRASALSRSPQEKRHYETRRPV